MAFFLEKDGAFFCCLCEQRIFLITGKVIFFLWQSTGITVWNGLMKDYQCGQMYTWELKDAYQIAG